MVIAINTRGLTDDYFSANKDFISETFIRIIQNNPEHTFIFISDRKNNNGIDASANVKQLVAGPASQQPLIWKFWFDVKIPALLKKHKADVFVSLDGICSLATNVPQCLVLQKLFFLDNLLFIKKNQLRYYKKYASKFLDKAKTIATGSDFFKQKIINQYNTEASKIDIIFSGADKKFIPVTTEEKSTIKNSYTENKEFFLYAGPVNASNNLINLLKAFSVFKKRQQTNMKLVLAGKVAKKYESFKESLKSYRYRNDVVLVENAKKDELTKIMASAYALINLSQHEGFDAVVIEAMQCEVPVIISENSSMRQIITEAALYAEGNSHSDIADKMMLLYKDENLRKQLIQKGNLVAPEYSWDKTANLLWQSICKAIS